MREQKLVIAIDGPAAAGKGTLARLLAAHFGLPHLDTGLLYRAVARRMLDQGADPADQVAAERAAKALQPAELERGDLRTQEVDRAASTVAAHPAVRAVLRAFQRRFPAERGAVMDGRDIGSVIFPEATVKLFVTASPKARAERRWRELTARGITAAPATIAAEIAERDHQDESRPVGRLVEACGAVHIDTTDLDAEQTFAVALSAVKAHIREVL
ncbi:MAG: (d)CMP kinase [Acetobacteraceae bacterium]